MAKVIIGANIDEETEQAVKKVADQEKGHSAKWLIYFFNWDWRFLKSKKLRNDFRLHKDGLRINPNGFKRGRYWDART